MKTETHPVRVEEWDAISVPDGYIVEIVQGELIVTPAADIGHGRAVTRLATLLTRFCPPELEPMMGPEWRVAQGGIVAMAPVPDVVVVSVDAEGQSLTEPPTLAIEVLSPSDRRRLANGLTRREGKLLDYAQGGLVHYLEVELSAPAGPTVTRYLLRAGELVQVDAAVGSGTLSAASPFPYQVCPADLVSRVR